MPDASFPVLMFAAGFGTRMKPLTDTRPKPLIEVAGKPLIDHAHALAKTARCDPIVANLHYKAEMLAEHLAPFGVQTLVESPDILETGGGLRNALPLLGRDPVVTLNTDAIWAGPNPITLLKNAWKPDEMDGLLICIPTDHAVGHASKGDFILTDIGRIERGPGHIFGGIQIIKTDQLDHISEPSFSLNVLWNRMLAQGRLFGLRYPGRWCDVGHPAGIEMAEDMLTAHDV